MSPAASFLVEAIRTGGAMPLERFMEAALYCPEVGYYEQACHTPGRDGDFFTSVSVGPVFGELLARRFCGWLEERPPSLGGRCSLVEGGAHDGRLAADLLSWLHRHRRDVFEDLDYVILESSPRRRAWQEARLGPWRSKVRWAGSWEELAAGGVVGVVFANELLDAMPAMRLGWGRASRSWFEWGVGWEGGEFVWTRLSRAPALPSSVGGWLDRVTQACGEGLPEGFALEVSPGALEWWAAAARALRWGYLVAFDYGWEEEEWMNPARGEGTLRGYRKHRLASTPLAAPGEQDITAHVNWTLIRQTGEAAGLKTLELRAQGRWLSGVLAEALERGEGEVGWASAEIRQFHTLTQPDQLGARFQVLVQSRRGAAAT